ncbi:hypothetical protein TNCV_4888991 [Trichonephila clavipes]|nr:hypothetical protein TNCV_4888991 [Trichonephila clavipes]
MCTEPEREHVRQSRKRSGPKIKSFRMRAQRAQMKTKVNLKKDELRAIVEELKLYVPGNAKVLDLRELIQESEIYKNDKETYQAIVDCVLEEINDRRNKNENRLEIEKIKLSQLEKELDN